MLLQTLKKVFGYDRFKEHQIPIIESVLAGQNTVAILPTGGGKSLCYQLPAIIQEGMAIIVTPLVALMKNQVDFLLSKNISASVLNATLSVKETREVRQKIEEGSIKLLYIAPETLNKEGTLALFQKTSISFLAIDEAHCISEWGFDFRPEYRKIQQTIKALGQIPVLALTATATPLVQQDIVNSLHIKEANIFVASFDRPNLYYEVAQKRKANKLLIQFLSKKEGQHGIIYCHSRKSCEEIALLLQRNHFKAVAYHGGIDNKKRAQHQDLFIRNEVDIIVATIAFGMGINKPDVNFVVHYDVPKSLEAYYQETGRAGRDGNPAHCLLLYDPIDVMKHRQRSRNKSVSERTNLYKQLQEMKTYAQTGICRRRQIMHYFGEAYMRDCQNCDNCKQVMDQYEIKSRLQLVLQAVHVTEGIFDKEHIANVLSGTENTDIIRHRHDQLPFFGEGKQHSTASWYSIIHQAALLGYLKENKWGTPHLTITPQGQAFMDKPHSVYFVKDHFFAVNRNEVEEDQPIVDEQLRDQLITLRAKEARKRNLQPYLLFKDNMLAYMAMTYPITLEGLQAIPGVSKEKAKKFGPPFISFIQAYAEARGLEPIEKVLIRPNRPSKYAEIQHITTQIDRRRDLNRLAKQQGISYLSLISKLEEMYNAGILVNLDYYINKILNPEQQKELYDYFHEMDEDDIDQICDKLGDDFDEDQIRLMRIKFLTEVAN